MADATLTALDLATGQALVLKAWGLGTTGTQRTDAKGAFDLELPKLADDQLVKLVAVSGSQTYTALFDARGRAVGAAGAQGASYHLAQGQAVSITIRLKLTAASTAAAKAFEGALKLTFQLPKDALEAERNAALAAAEQAARDVAAALAEKPALARDLVVSVGPDGEVKDLDAFRSAIARLGVFDRVFSAVQGRLVAVAAQKLTAGGTLAPITAEDFPLDRVRIGQDGGFAFTGGTIGSLGGSVTSHFVPTPVRNTRRNAPVDGDGPDDGPDLGYLDEATTVAAELEPNTYNESKAVCAIDDDAPHYQGWVLLPAQREYYAGNFIFDGQLVQQDRRKWSDEGDLINGIVGGSGAASFFVLGGHVESGVGKGKISKYNLVPDQPGTFTPVASATVDGVTDQPQNSLFGGEYAAGRVWAIEAAFDQLPQGRIVSFEDRGTEFGAPQYVASGGTDVTLLDVQGYGKTVYDLAVYADGQATHVYWINNDGDLYRVSQVGAQTTATMLTNLPNTSKTGAVALLRGATSHPDLYVVYNGEVYCIHDPANVTQASLAQDPEASQVIPSPDFPAGLNVWSADQVRDGSLLFVTALQFYTPAGTVHRLKVK